MELEEKIIEQALKLLDEGKSSEEILRAFPFQAGQLRQILLLAKELKRQAAPIVLSGQFKTRLRLSLKPNKPQSKAEGLLSLINKLKFITPLAALAVIILLVLLPKKEAPDSLDSQTIYGQIMFSAEQPDISPLGFVDQTQNSSASKLAAGFDTKPQADTLPEVNLPPLLPSANIDALAAGIVSDYTSDSAVAMSGGGETASTQQAYSAINVNDVYDPSSF